MSVSVCGTNLQKPPSMYCSQKITKGPERAEAHQCASRANH